MFSPKDFNIQTFLDELSWAALGSFPLAATIFILLLDSGELPGPPQGKCSVPLLYKRLATQTQPDSHQVARVSCDLWVSFQGKLIQPHQSPACSDATLVLLRNIYHAASPVARARKLQQLSQLSSAQAFYWKTVFFFFKETIWCLQSLFSLLPACSKKGYGHSKNGLLYLV